ncbi:hypothetical protein D3C78_1344870 [compost metagenome]
MAAIWWLAAARLPWRAMNKAIKVNEVTSTRMARPAGRPRRRKWPSWTRSGASMRCHSCKGVYSDRVRISHRPRPSSV